MLVIPYPIQYDGILFYCTILLISYAKVQHQEKPGFCLFCLFILCVSDLLLSYLALIVDHRSGCGGMLLGGSFGAAGIVVGELSFVWHQ